MTLYLDQNTPSSPFINLLANSSLTLAGCSLTSLATTVTLAAAGSLTLIAATFSLVYDFSALLLEAGGYESGCVLGYTYIPLNATALLALSQSLYAVYLVATYALMVAPPLLIVHVVGLAVWSFTVIPVSELVLQRAAFCIEQYCLNRGERTLRYAFAAQGEELDHKQSHFLLSPRELELFKERFGELFYRNLDKFDLIYSQYLEVMKDPGLTPEVKHSSLQMKKLRLGYLYYSMRRIIEWGDLFGLDSSMLHSKILMPQVMLDKVQKLSRTPHEQIVFDSFQNAIMLKRRLASRPSQHELSLYRAAVEIAGTALDDLREHTEQEGASIERAIAQLQRVIDQEKQEAIERAVNAGTAPADLTPDEQKYLELIFRRDSNSYAILDLEVDPFPIFDERLEVVLTPQDGDTPDVKFAWDSTIRAWQKAYLIDQDPFYPEDKKPQELARAIFEFKLACEKRHDHIGRRGEGDSTLSRYVSFVPTKTQLTTDYSPKLDEVDWRYKDYKDMYVMLVDSFRRRRDLPRERQKNHLYAIGLFMPQGRVEQMIRQHFREERHNLPPSVYAPKRLMRKEEFLSVWEKLSDVQTAETALTREAGFDFFTDSEVHSPNATLELYMAYEHAGNILSAVITESLPADKVASSPSRLKYAEQARQARLAIQYYVLMHDSDPTPTSRRSSSASVALSAAATSAAAREEAEPQRALPPHLTRLERLSRHSLSEREPFDPGLGDCLSSNEVKVIETAQEFLERGFGQLRNLKRFIESGRYYEHWEQETIYSIDELLGSSSNGADNECLIGAYRLQLGTLAKAQKCPPISLPLHLAVMSLVRQLNECIERRPPAEVGGDGSTRRSTSYA